MYPFFALLSAYPMFDYKLIYTAFNKGFKLQIKEFKEITLLGYIQMYTGVHSDASQKSYSFELFDLSLDVAITRDTCMAYVSLHVDSFDMRCKSITYNYL